jgi:hypothetical protein
MGEGGFMLLSIRLMGAEIVVDYTMVAQRHEIAHCCQRLASMTVTMQLN